MRKLIVFLFIGFFLLCVAEPVGAQDKKIQVKVLNSSGQETQEIIDGNTIGLRIKLPQSLDRASSVIFSLKDQAGEVESCEIPAGSDGCSSGSFSALGWYWDAAGSGRPVRVIVAEVNGQQVELAIKIRPRPVVLVHGFISSWETWKPYLGSSGYLASIGLQGFAVGDGQFAGKLNTGDSGNPAGHTNTLAQNAQILGDYIAAVQKSTGAEKVDLLVHSMGGMISRYYLDRVMSGERVAQVIFLGSPMAGSACTYPLAAMGLLTPASQEILPYYMINVFNQQILRRHGVPFYMVAGTLLMDPLTSPCAEAPSDSVVALGSARFIQMDEVQELPMYHGDFTGSREVFEKYIRGRLQAPPGSFSPRPDLKAASVTQPTEQFSKVYGGHLAAGGEARVEIDIDPDVSLATFSLFDSSRSLAVEVRGASGKVINLDTKKNGLIEIHDPAVMFYLGYGFKNPKPGKWVVAIRSTAQTPAAGADYALTARYVGGAVLTARSSQTIVDIGQPVTLTAQLEAPGMLSGQAVTAQVRGPAGEVETLLMTLKDGEYSAVFTPRRSGLFSAEVNFKAKNVSGTGIDRAAFLAFEVQPGLLEVLQARSGVVLLSTAVVVCLGVAGLIVLAVLVYLFWRRRNKKILT